MTDSFQFIAVVREAIHPERRSLYTAKVNLHVSLSSDQRRTASS